MSGEPGNEDALIRITCPHCRRPFQKAAAWVDTHDYVRCDFCREPIGLGVYKARKRAASPVAAKASPPPAAKARTAPAKPRKAKR